MHPVILQQLAAERVSDMITKVDDWHQACLAWRSDSTRQKARLGLPRTQAEIEPSPADTAARAVPAIGMSRSSADDGQGRELVVAERGFTRTQ
jgi:hypothetical protein